MSEHRVVIRISKEAADVAKKYADSRDAELGATVDALITTGVSRRHALAKYAKKAAPRASKKRRAKTAKRLAKRRAKGQRLKKSKRSTRLAAKFKPLKKRGERKAKATPADAPKLEG